MKKITIMTLAIMGLSSLTFAETAYLNLLGTVAKVVDISVISLGSQSLDLTTTTVNQKVGTVTEKSNSVIGYKVEVSSVNSGNLQHSNGDSFAYSLSYGGVDAKLISGGTIFSEATTGLSTKNKDVAISYTGRPAAEMTSGDYEDVVTFEIVAN